MPKNHTQYQLSIVIPCYNEAGNLPRLVAAIADAVNRDDIEVILVNNGSEDGSAELLPELVEHYPHIRALHLLENRGYGGGILAGLETAKGQFIGWMHADLQTPPADMIRAYQIVKEAGFDKHIFVKGQRVQREFIDHVFSHAMGEFESWYFKTKLTEINAQPTVFHRSFMKKWDKPPQDFSLDLYVYYLATYYQLNIHRFDVVFGKRYAGESSWNRGMGDRIRFIQRTMRYSKELKKHLKHTLEQGEK